mgnify:CR=1 FL=1
MCSSDLAIPRFHDGPAALPADRIATPLPLALRPGYEARVRDEETVVSLVTAALLVVVVAVLALDDATLRDKLLAYRAAQTERVLKEQLETEGPGWSDRPSEK